MLGVHHSTVQEDLADGGNPPQKANSTPKTGGNPPPSSSQIRKREAHQQNAVSQRKIAAVLGVGHKTVDRDLDTVSNDTKKVDSGTKPVSNDTPSSSQIRKREAHQQNAVSQRKIAAVLGVDESTIRADKNAGNPAQQANTTPKTWWKSRTVMEIHHQRSTLPK